MATGRFGSDLEAISYANISPANDLLTICDVNGDDLGTGPEDKKIPVVEFAKRSLASADVSWMTTLAMSAVVQADDKFLMWDASATSFKVVTGSDLLAFTLAGTSVSGITTLTLSGVDATADYAAVFDASAGVWKKVVASAVFRKIPVIYMEEQGVSASNSASANSTAIAAAITAGGDSCKFVWPRGIIEHDATLVFPGNYVHNEGIGPQATVLLYTGTGVGVTIGATGKGYVSYFNSIKNMSLRHSDTSASKVVLQLIDQAEFKFDDCYISTLGGNSVGLVWRGRQHPVIDGVTISAPIPIQLGHNSESSPAGSFSSDFVEIRQAELITPALPTTWPAASILVGEYNSDGTLDSTKPVQVTNVVGDGASCIGSLYGYHHIASTVPGSLRNHTIVFRNFRKEQTPTPASKTITNVVDNGSGLCRVTAAAHGLITGTLVTVASVGGATQANGDWVVTRIDANTIDLKGSAFSSAYTSGGTVSAVPTCFAVNLPTKSELSASTHGGLSFEAQDVQGELSGQVGLLFARGIEHVRLQECNNYGGSSLTVDVDDIEVMSWDGVYQASSSRCNFGSKLKLGVAGSHRQGYPYPTHGIWNSHQYVDTQNPQLRIGDMEVFTWTGTLADDGTVLLPLDNDAKTVRSATVTVTANNASTTAETGIFMLAPGSGTNGVTVLTGSTSNVAATDSDTDLCLYATGTLTDTTVKNRLGASCVVTVFAIVYRTSKS